MNFENRYTTSDRMLSEYIKKVQCKKLRIWGLGLGIIAAIMCVITVIEEDYIITGIMGACFFILTMVSILTPYFTLKQMKEAGLKLHNGKNCETIIQFGDKIIMDEGTIHITIEYSQIIKAVSLPNVYVLVIGPNNAVLVDPNGFIVGNFTDFQIFIEKKIKNKDL